MDLLIYKQNKSRKLNQKDKNLPKNPNKTVVEKLDANAKAIADLRKGLNDSINVREVKLKQERDTEQQYLEHHTNSKQN